MTLIDAWKERLSLKKERNRVADRKSGVTPLFNFILVNPRLCRGDQRSLTFPGILFCDPLVFGPGARAMRAESIGWDERVRRRFQFASARRGGTSGRPRGDRPYFSPLGEAPEGHERPVHERQRASWFLHALPLRPGRGKSWPPWVAPINPL